MSLPYCVPFILIWAWFLPGGRFRQHFGRWACAGHPSSSSDPKMTYPRYTLESPHPAKDNKRPHQETNRTFRDHPDQLHDTHHSCEPFPSACGEVARPPHNSPVTSLSLQTNKAPESVQFYTPRSALSNSSSELTSHCPYVIQMDILNGSPRTNPQTVHPG